MLNCLWLSGKKDEFLKDAKTFIDESKSYDQNISDNTHISLNNLRMHVGNLYHNDGDWQKAREVYLAVSDTDSNQYINARARAAQSLYFGGDYISFEKEFVKIEAMKGELQSLEMEDLLLNAAGYSEIIDIYDLASERFQKYLDTTKFSPLRNRLIAKAALGKNLYNSVKSTPSIQIEDQNKSEMLYDKREKAVAFLNEFITEATTLLEDPELPIDDQGPLAYAIDEIVHFMGKDTFVVGNASKWSKKFQYGSYEWMQQMFWLGGSQYRLHNLEEALNVFKAVLFSGAKDPYVSEHIPTKSAHWVMGIASELNDKETAKWALEWVKQRCI